MAQTQENADLKDSPEWVVIADDWVDDEMDDDDFDQAKSKNELPDHVVTSPGIAEDEPKVLTRYVDVPEEIVKFFAGEDVVMDLQIASGAMIQVTYEVDAKYRPVRLIGNLENVEKAEKLIKAVVALADAGGSAFLRKHDGHHQKQETYQSHNYSHYPESWGPFQVHRKRSHKRTPPPFFTIPTGRFIRAWRF